MVLSESQVKEILDKIKEAAINPTNIHLFDEKRVRNLFNIMLKNNMIYDTNDIKTIIGHLNPEYSDYTAIIQRKQYPISLKFSYADF